MYKYLDYKNYEKKQLIAGISFMILTMILGTLIVGRLTWYVIAPSIIAFFIPNADRNTIKLIFIISIIQNILLISISSQLDSRGNTFLAAFKEIISIYLIVYSYLFLKFEQFKNIFKYKKWREVKDVYVYILIVILIIYCFINITMFNVNIKGSIHSIRQLFIPILALLVGKAVQINNEEEIFDISKFIIYTSIFLIVFGVIEIVFLKDQFWVNLGIEQFTINKGSEAWASENGVPKNWHSADFIPITGMWIRRLVSIVAEPLALGHIFSFVFLILLFNKNLFSKKCRYMMLTVFGLGVILTISKGAIMVIAIGCIIYAFITCKNRKIPIIIMAVIICIGIIVSAFAINDYNKTGKRNSIVNHIQGLTHNFEDVSLLGTGLGSSGNYANLYNKEDAVGMGESFIGAILGQTGIVGLLLFTLIIGKIIYDIVKYKDGFKNIHMIYFILTLTTAVLVECFLSESAISFVGTSIYFIYLGMIHEYTMAKK